MRLSAQKRTVDIQAKKAPTWTLFTFFPLKSSRPSNSQPCECTKPARQSLPVCVSICSVKPMCFSWLHLSFFCFSLKVLCQCLPSSLSFVSIFLLTFIYSFDYLAMPLLPIPGSPQSPPITHTHHNVLQQKILCNIYFFTRFLFVHKRSSWFMSQHCLTIKVLLIKYILKNFSKKCRQHFAKKSAQIKVSMNQILLFEKWY